MPRAAIAASAFDPKDIRLMLEVYDEVIEQLGYSGGGERTELARLVMQLCAWGATDKESLKAAVLSALRR